VSAVLDLTTTVLPHVAALVPMEVDIDPNSSGLPGIAQLRTIVGAVMTIGLILRPRADHLGDRLGLRREQPTRIWPRGKIGVLVSCGAAIICGASVTLINFFWNVGQAV
jgi:hypothetical protein